MSLILSIPFNNSVRNIGLQKNTITSIPSVTPSYIAGPVNNALSFDGSTYWKSQGITLGADATICFWSKTSTNGKMPWVLESDASNKLCLYESTYYTLNTGDGNTNLFKTDSNASISVLRDNVWHHFAVTFGDGVAKLYIDGLYKGKAITFRNPTTTNKPIKIGGGYSNGHTYDWNGGIADFRVYDHCLTEYDINWIYNGDTKTLQVSLPFDKDERNIGLYDVSAENNGATLINDAVVGNCIYLDGTNDYINVPFKDFDNNFSISEWFYIENGNTTAVWPICSREAAYGGITCFVTTGGVLTIDCASVANSSSRWTTATNISKETWYHIAIIRNQQKIWYYINGDFVAEKQIEFSNTFGNVLTIGCRNTNGGDYTNFSKCKIDDFRIYNLALTDEDVKRIYQKEEIIILPTEYEKLEYIQSTGTQWIDVGVKANQNTKAEIKFEITGNATGYNAVFGSRTSYTSNAFNVWSKCGNGNIGANYCKAGAINSTIAQAANVTYYITLEKNKLSVNDSVTTFTQNTNFTTPGNIYLFNIYGGDATSTGTSNRILIGKVYSFKLYDSDIIIRNMIPSRRKSDNVIGMYDMVSRQFFTNSGSGSFTGA